MFVAVNATLKAKSVDNELDLPMSEFFKGYRVTALPADAIIASIRIPVSRDEGEFVRAYKQAKRKDDDIAIVNAALRVSDRNMKSRLLRIMFWQNSMMCMSFARLQPVITSPIATDEIYVGFT